MNVQEMVNRLDLVAVSGMPNPNKAITGGYVSDLLSNVMGNAREGNVWVTMQSHQNIVAVAVLLNLAAIIITDGTVPDETAIRKANTEGVLLLTTKRSSFETAGLLYELGVRASC